LRPKTKFDAAVVVAIWMLSTACLKAIVFPNTQFGAPMPAKLQITFHREAPSSSSEEGSARRLEARLRTFATPCFQNNLNRGGHYLFTSNCRLQFAVAGSDTLQQSKLLGVVMRFHSSFAWYLTAGKTNVADLLGLIHLL
jgi:hypothetical protein